MLLKYLTSSTIFAKTKIKPRDFDPLVFLTKSHYYKKKIKKFLKTAPKQVIVENIKDEKEIKRY